jgi:hypothetical protein
VPTPEKATIKETMNYFGMPIAQFGKEWRELDAAAKEQIQVGIGNGSFTY